MNIDIKSSDYQRLFEVTAMPVIISDIFREYYQTLECLLIFHENTWTSYLPKAVVERTMQDGIKLFGDAKIFQSYRDGFASFEALSRDLFARVLSSDTLVSEQVSDFLDRCSDFFSFYSKTEFFYTDQAFAESQRTGSGTLQTNLKELETIKNNGREILNGIFFGKAGSLNQLLTRIGTLFGVSEEDILCYRREELLALFDQQKLPEEEIRNRQLAYLMKGDGKETMFVTGSEAEAVIGAFETATASEGAEIRGRTANPGLVRGRVKIISSGYDTFDRIQETIREMEQGDVLVSETTSPELIVACKKASAIVTNQGGMTSHAAIVSRELDIPCIVGTGNATKILKDGDEVEVDATKGIVKILKRA